MRAVMVGIWGSWSTCGRLGVADFHRKLGTDPGNIILNSTDTYDLLAGAAIKILTRQPATKRRSIGRNAHIANSKTVAISPGQGSVALHSQIAAAPFSAAPARRRRR